MTDQQRSDAVTEKKRCCCQCGKEIWCYISEEVQAAIAERDATIDKLETDLQESDDENIRLKNTIAALRARVVELDDFIEWLNSDAITLLDFIRTHSATIAERDATIAELRAANERLAEAQDEQIAALQSRVADLEAKKPISQLVKEFSESLESSTPTTEKPANDGPSWMLGAMP